MKRGFLLIRRHPDLNVRLKMKIPRILLFCFVFADLATSQVMKEGKVLSPKDLGIDKRVFSAELEKNFVMVVTTTVDMETYRQWSSRVYYDESGKVKDSILIYDHGVFDESKRGHWTLGQFGGGLLWQEGASIRPGEGWLEYRFRPLEVKDGHHFGNREGFQSRLVVTVEVLPYAEVKKRCPALDKVLGDGGWATGFGNTYIKGKGWMGDVLWKPKAIKEAEKREQPDNSITLMQVAE